MKRYLPFLYLFGSLRLILPFVRYAGMELPSSGIFVFSYRIPDIKTIRTTSALYCLSKAF